MLVGPPAEERGVPNNEPPIQCDKIGFPVAAAAFWPLPGSARAKRPREPHSGLGGAESSHSSAAFSLTVVDESPCWIHSTLTRSGPRRNGRDK